MYILGIVASRLLRHKFSSGVARTLGRLHLQPLPTVAVDIDGVLADQVPHVLSRANPQFGIHMTKADITSWNTPVGNVPFDQLIATYLLDSKFVMAMPELEGAKQVLENIRKRARIIVTSSRPKTTEGDTIRWLKDHYNLGGSQFVNTSRTGKSALGANVLIDDNLNNVEDFARSNSDKYGILLDQLWNRERCRIQDLINAKKILVMRGWSQVADLLA